MASGRKIFLKTGVARAGAVGKGASGRKIVAEAYFFSFSIKNANSELTAGGRSRVLVVGETGLQQNFRRGGTEGGGAEVRIEVGLVDFSGLKRAGSIQTHRMRPKRL